MHTSELKDGQDVICQQMGLHWMGTIIKQGKNTSVEYVVIGSGTLRIRLRNYKADSTVRGSEGHRNGVYNESVYVFPGKMP